MRLRKFFCMVLSLALVASCLCISSSAIEIAGQMGTPIVMRASGKFEIDEFFHLIGICISVSEGISFIKICRNRKNAEMYVDIIGPYRNQFLISQAILFAIGAMIYPITFLMRIEDGLGSAVYLFIISFRRIMLWAYKKRYSVQK